jgi:V8-like Glu-specific endopeptidase
MIARSKRRGAAAAPACLIAGAIACVATLTACGVASEGGDEPVTTIESPVVFGTDNRVENSPVQNARYRALANATAALIDDINVTSAGGTYSIRPIFSTFDDVETATSSNRPLCPGVFSAGQARRARCTAFLIGPNLFATAGHCMNCRADGVCEVPYRMVVFNFDTAHTDAGGIITVPETDVYVVDGTPVGIDNFTTTDWAVFRVNRLVKGHTPLTPQLSGVGTSRGELAIAGHPDMVPLKLARDGWVKVDSPLDKITFFTSLDAFAGNSGSPVVDFTTGVVLGIHVRRPFWHYTDVPDGNGGQCATPTVCSATTGCNPNFGESPWSIETRMTLAMAGAKITLQPAQIVSTVF